MKKQHAVTSVVLAALLAVGTFSLTACEGQKQPVQDGNAAEQQSEDASKRQDTGEQDEQAVIDAVQGVIDKYLLNPSDELKQQLAQAFDENFKRESPELRDAAALDDGVSLTDVGVDPMDVVNDKSRWLDFTSYSCVVKYENGVWQAEPTEQVPESYSFKEWWDKQFDDAFNFDD